MSRDSSVTKTIVTAFSALAIAGCELTTAPTRVTSAPSEGTSATTKGTTEPTSGVTGSSSPKRGEEKQVSNYVSQNFDRVKANMAVGGGPYLESLANLLGVSKAQRPAFFALVKSNYPTWFASEKTTADQISDRLFNLMKQHPELKK
ncbi:MAG: DUF3015 family protein [Methylotetracoccus sp.]